MGEELQKAGIDFRAAEKNSEKLEKNRRSSTDAKYSAPAFGNPKFYVDPEEEQDGAGKVGGGREKHLANVVKELLKDGLAGKVNKSDQPPARKQGQDDSDQSNTEETSLPAKDSGEDLVQKNAFREIVALMGEEEGGKDEKEENEGKVEESEVPRNLETEMVRTL